MLSWHIIWLTFLYQFLIVRLHKYQYDALVVEGSQTLRADPQEYVTRFWRETVQHVLSWGCSSEQTVFDVSLIRFFVVIWELQFGPFVCIELNWPAPVGTCCLWELGWRPLNVVVLRLNYISKVVLYFWSGFLTIWFHEEVMLRYISGWRSRAGCWLIWFKQVEHIPSNPTHEIWGGMDMDLTFIVLRCSGSGSAWP